MLLIAPTPYYIEKGSSLRVHSMVQRYRAAGYDVDVLCYPKGSDPGLDGVDVVRAGLARCTTTEAGPAIGDLFNDVFVTARAIKLLATGSYDLVQGEDVEGIAIALLAGAPHDIETVYDLHNPLTENLAINDVPVPQAISRAVEKFLYTRSDAILTNWHVWERHITARYGLDRVETVYDRLPDSQQPIDLPASRYVAYVGNFKRYQGVDLLVDAYGSIASEVSFDLVLVGESTPEIERPVRQSPVRDRIHLLGRCDIPEANYVIANAAACVVPRRTGKQPGTKLVHYGMFGGPIVATDLECNRELSRFDNPVLWAEPTAPSIGKCLREVDRDG